MGFLSNPIEAEQASGISKAFLMGAAQQASENATARANEREDAQTKLAAKQASIDAVTAAHQATVDALRTAKTKSAKDVFEANKSLLNSQRTEAYNKANTAPGLIDDPSRQRALDDVATIEGNMSKLDQGYAGYVSTVAAKDPTAIPDFGFDPKSGLLPPQLSQMGIIPATNLAEKNQDIQDKKAKLLGGGSEKLTEAQKNARKAEDDFNGNAADVNTKLDLFNTENAQYGIDSKKDPSKSSPDKVLGAAGGLLNSYRGFWNGIQTGRYNDLDPDMKQVAAVVQKSLGANWNHPRAASQQIGILNRYFINNPSATPSSKVAAQRIFNAVQSRVPQLEAITPYYNQIEQAPQ